MKKSVTSLQVFSLYNLHIFTTVIAFLLGMLITGSGFTTPLATLIGAFLTILIIYPSYKVGSSRPDEFITEYGGELVGRIPHIFFILYIVMIKLLLSAINLREMADFLLTEYLSGTPHWAILFIFCICVGYAVRSGVNVIFRSAQGIFLVSAVAFLLIPILAMQEIETDALIALVTNINAKELTTGIFLNMGMFGEISFLFVMYPYLKNTKKIYRTYFATALSAIVIIMSHMIPILLTFGPQLAANLTYPDLELIRFIRVGSYIESLDPILIILWLTSIYIKISFLVFTAVLCIAQLTGIKDHKPLTLPVIAFIGVMSIAFARSQPELADFLWNLAPVLLFGELVIPAIYWIMLLIKGKRKLNAPAEHKKTADPKSAGS